MPVQTRNMTKRAKEHAEAPPVERTIQLLQEPIRTEYMLPAFYRSVKSPWLCEPEHCIQFSADEVKNILNLFEGHTYRDGTSMVLKFKAYLKVYLLGGIRSDKFLEDDCEIRVANIRQFVSKGLHELRIWSSFPYNYILYGRTKKEMDDIAAEYWDISGPVVWAFSNCHNTYIPQEPHEEFKKVFDVNIKLLEAEILLTKGITNNDRMVELIRREADYLSEHYNHTMERLTGEQRELVLMEILNVKGKINDIVTKYRIQLPNDLYIQLCRPERIFATLTAEKQLEDGATQNVKKVIQNSDLNRYLMEFV